MAMQQRERILALSLGLVVGLILLYWGYGQYTSMFSRREQDLASVEAAVAKKDAQFRRIQKAKSRVAASWKNARFRPTKLKPETVMGIGS